MAVLAGAVDCRGSEYVHWTTRAFDRSDACRADVHWVCRRCLCSHRDHERRSAGALWATRAGAVRADVNIDFGAGTLIVSPLPEASADLIDANYFGRRGRTNIRRTGDTAIVDVTMDGRNFFRHFDNVRWELALSSTPQITFDLDGGAADMDVDLSGLRVADLDANIGAADISIVLPETGTVRADI
jgi:hypothetical protein